MCHRFDKFIIQLFRVITVTYLSGVQRGVMNNNIHFYASTKNDYISPVSLWSVARVSVNNEGVRWLETQWTGGSDLQGMALYVSALDAAIAAEVLNKSGGTQEWQVYPFADLNITEMMIAMKARKPEYCIMLAFGFTIDDFRHLVLHSALYRSLQFPETFLISDGLNPVSNQAILKFNESLFDEMNKYWHEEFANYCESMEYQNSLPVGLIKEHARKAVSTAMVTTTPIVSGASQYCVSTYSIEKKDVDRLFVRRSRR